jgi:hypothetical protein
MVPSEEKYIKGLALNDMFNDLDNKVYGPGPLYFVPVRRDVRRIEFIPRDEGGGVRDMDVPANDPRMNFTEDEEGNRMPPVATKFDEYVILVLREDAEPDAVVLSIPHRNKWNREAAKKLNTFIVGLKTKDKKPAPIYGGLYTLSVVSAKNDKGTFGVFSVKQAGYPNAQIYAAAKELHEKLQGKNIVTEREPGDDDVSFNESEM